MNKLPRCAEVTSLTRKLLPFFLGPKIVKIPYSIIVGRQKLPNMQINIQADKQTDRRKDRQTYLSYRQLQHCIPHCFYRDLPPRRDSEHRSQ